ncbi:SlyX family protein [Phaeobacter sp. HF9A]|uniref:SlyX family protein n=1 Tax=Phaeobacter sp. HF9A TaxID=2721561 RepID=UPI001431D0FD|nr:SlyX family protein [Phaeobacter sp. HF9A]
MTQHLEEHIAHLTRTVEELNEIVTAQQTDIDLLKRRVQMLMEREAQREAEGSGGAVFTDERPPHY